MYPPQPPPPRQGRKLMPQEKPMINTPQKITGTLLLAALLFCWGGCAGALSPEAWAKTKGGNLNDLNATINQDDETLAHLAAREGRVDVLIWLKQRGADLNTKRTPPSQSSLFVFNEDGGPTLMHFAAEGGHVQTMKWLKEQGGKNADVNAKASGWTPMHAAAEGGHLEAMKWLKEQGVDPKARNQNGQTAMHFAAGRGNLEAMKWLKDMGVSVSAKDYKGRTPLDLARDKEAISWLKANDKED